MGERGLRRVWKTEIFMVFPIPFLYILQSSPISLSLFRTSLYHLYHAGPIEALQYITVCNVIALESASLLILLQMGLRSCGSRRLDGNLTDALLGFHRPKPLRRVTEDKGSCDDFGR